MRKLIMVGMFFVLFLGFFCSNSFAGITTAEIPVVKHDTIGKIAEKYYVSFRVVMELNEGRFADSNFIKPGDTVVIPVVVIPVVQDDTIRKIAKKHHVPSREVLVLNEGRFADLDLIFPNDTVIIPDTKRVVAPKVPGVPVYKPIAPATIVMKDNVAAAIKDQFSSKIELIKKASGTLNQSPMWIAFCVVYLAAFITYTPVAFPIVLRFMGFKRSGNEQKEDWITTAGAHQFVGFRNLKEEDAGIWQLPRFKSLEELKKKPQKKEFTITVFLKKISMVMEKEAQEHDFVGYAKEIDRYVYENKNGSSSFQSQNGVAGVAQFIVDTQGIGSVNPSAFKIPKELEKKYLPLKIQEQEDLQKYMQCRQAMNRLKGNKLALEGG